ncbi:MAG: hypothetical protein ACOH2Q_01940 [Rhodococcus sp. (in: high G+C Gram-positive bacteria)]
MTNNSPSIDAATDDIIIETLDEVSGAGTASTAGTISTPATAGTAACLSCF